MHRAMRILAIKSLPVFLGALLAWAPLHGCNKKENASTKTDESSTKDKKAGDDDDNTAVKGKKKKGDDNSTGDDDDDSTKKTKKKVAAADDDDDDDDNTAGLGAKTGLVPAGDDNSKGRRGDSGPSGVTPPMQKKFDAGVHDAKTDAAEVGAAKVGAAIGNPTPASKGLLKPKIGGGK